MRPPDFECMNASQGPMIVQQQLESMEIEQHSDITGRPLDVVQEEEDDENPDWVAPFYNRTRDAEIEPLESLLKHYKHEEHRLPFKAMNAPSATLYPMDASCQPVTIENTVPKWSMSNDGMGDYWGLGRSSIVSTTSSLWEGRRFSANRESSVSVFPFTDSSITAGIDSCLSRGLTGDGVSLLTTPLSPVLVSSHCILDTVEPSNRIARSAGCSNTHRKMPSVDTSPTMHKNTIEICNAPISPSSSSTEYATSQFFHRGTGPSLMAFLDSNTPIATPESWHQPVEGRYPMKNHNEALAVEQMLFSSDTYAERIESDDPSGYYRAKRKLSAFKPEDSPPRHSMRRTSQYVSMPHYSFPHYASQDHHNQQQMQCNDGHFSWVLQENNRDHYLDYCKPYQSDESLPAIARPQTPGRYDCPVCQKKYRNLNGLKYHFNNFHVKQEGKTMEDLEKSRQEMLDQRKPFACRVEGCVKRYQNRNGLKYHMKHTHKASLATNM